MRIESKDRNSFLEINIENAYCLDDDSWHVTAGIRLSTDWFTATITDISLYRNFIEQFLEALRELNVRRKGSAMLQGLGYSSFELSFYNINERGYIGIRLSMEKYDLATERHLLKASAGFDLDPGEVPRVLAEFEHLFNKQRLAQEFAG